MEATYTHTLSWTDEGGVSHSMTLRADDLQGLIADIKQVKELVRLSNSKRCPIHGEMMDKRISKKSGKEYHAHNLSNNEICFGTAREKAC